MLPFFFILRQKKKAERVRFSFFKFKSEILRFLVNHIDIINNIIKKWQERKKIARQILTWKNYHAINLICNF